ncbi:hypothetical protein I4U23_013506 [Adineta vaga]|nr:hypothetical protein I4U23_013506 [Adineta vaga]
MTVPNANPFLLSISANEDRCVPTKRTISRLTGQPKEINGHIDEPWTPNRSLEHRRSNINQNEIENLLFLHSSSVQIQYELFSSSLQDYESQISHLVYQATETSISLPIIQTVKRSISAVDAQSCNDQSIMRKSKRHRTTSS